jgi:hypothetical protein
MRSIVFGVTPTVVQSAYDSWGWTDAHDRDPNDYEVVGGVIQEKA